VSPRDVDKIVRAIESAGGSIAFAVFMGLIWGACMIATYPGHK